MLEFVLRKGTKSLKYDELKERFGSESLLSLWVADMDCRAPVAVSQAIAQRLEHGVFGYSSREQADSSKNAVCHWLATRHSVQGLEQQDCLIFAGVMDAIAICIAALCDKNETVILNSPAYNCYWPMLEASGRPILENHLRLDGSMDFDLLEQQIKDNRARIFLLCSPHNPLGKIWSEADILELLRICQKYDLYVISDEIHFDLIYSDYKHLCILRQEFCSVYDKIIMISAPSKAFNIPALRSAYLVSKNQKARELIQRFATQFQIGDISLTGHLALEACYTQPSAVLWLDELLQYLEQNRDLLCDYLAKEFPELRHRKPEGTYLYWVDCRDFLNLHGDPAALRKFFVTAGLALGWGDLYHGNGWMRINFGCERALLQEALAKWKQAYENFSIS